MPQLREIPLKPKPPFTPTTTGLGSASGIMSLQRSTALVTPPATPSMPPPRYPQPKPPSQELMFRNLYDAPSQPLLSSLTDELIQDPRSRPHPASLQRSIRPPHRASMPPLRIPAGGDKGHKLEAQARVRARRRRREEAQTRVHAR